MNYFIFKNIDSRDIKGLIVQELPPISKPAKRIEKIEIDGKDGDIIQESGYQAYDKTISIGLTNNYDINQIIAWLDGSGNLVLSNEPEKYYNAIVIEQIDFERLMRFKTAKIKFHVQPFKYKANEEYSLVKDRKDKTVSGTSIDINDSAEAKINELKISGNRKQETRSGKNRIGFKNCDKTINGVRIIVKDGVITLNGTCTADNTLILGLEDSMHKNTSIKVGNSLSAFYVSGSMNGYLTYRLFDNNYKVNSLLDISVLNTTKTYIKNSINTNFTIEPNNCNFRINKDTIFNNFSFKLMFTDNEDSIYEQYGASPSSEYPSENECCGDNINLFDKSTTTDGKYINNSGFEETQSGIMHSDYIQIELNKDFYISGRNEWASIALYDKNKAFLERIATTKPNGILNITNSNCKYIIINALLADKETLKIEKGSIPTPYSPYSQGCINEVICNKNLFDIKNLQYIDGYGLGDTGFFARGDQRTYIIPILKNEKEISVSYTKTITGSRYYAFADEIPTGANSPHYGRVLFANSFDIGKIIFTAKNNNYKYLLLGSTTSEVLTDLQVEQNPTVTPYVEHKSQNYTIPTQEPFRECGDIRDTFIKKNNKWYERHYQVEIVVDGTETINKSSSKEFFTISKIMSNLDTSSSAVNISKSNYGTGTTLGLGEGNTNNKYSFNASTIYLDCYGSNINTVDKLKAQLSETPMEIYALLKTPTDIECTEEQSTILWDIEQNAKTYDKVTHIYSTDEISPNVEVTYLTPTDEKISNEGNIQSRPILRLEKTVSEAVELTINDIRFKYNFEDDSYVEIDCEEKTVEYEGLKRNRQIIIGYEFPRLDIGNNNIIMHEGDCIIKILRKDRWL